jgi:hypothetical protein
MALNNNSMKKTRNEQTLSLRVFSVTYNMARTKIDFDCSKLLPECSQYDIIAIGFQEAKMGNQREVLLKLVNYLEGFGF